jgi:hypothetical protein
MKIHSLPTTKIFLSVSTAFAVQCCFLTTENESASRDAHATKKIQSMVPVPRKTTTEWIDNWDGREDLIHPKPGVRHQIILLRHGQYFSDRKDKEHEQFLTEKGVKQSQLTGQRISELIKHGVLYPIDRLHYSTMIRAKQSFQEIHQQLSLSSLLPPQPHQISACSLIREVVPFRPIPDEHWNVREEIFFKDQQRVRKTVSFISPLLSSLKTVLIISFLLFSSF